MPWFKVDDNLAFSSKVMLAGNAGMGLWVRAGSWSAAQLTDGFIPSHVALALGSPDEATSLVKSGLWVESDGGYQFHDWDDYQPKKDDVLKEREDKRQRMADLRAKRRDAARAESVTSNSRVTTPARAGSVTNLCSSPDPTRPDPTYIETPTVSHAQTASRSSEHATRFDEFWATYPRKVGKDKCRAKYTAAIKRAGDEQTVIDGAHRLAADPNLPEKQYIPHPTTWLERGGWNDEPLPPRMDNLSGSQRRLMQAAEQSRNRQASEAAGQISAFPPIENPFANTRKEIQR